MPEILVHHADYTRIKGIWVRRTRFLSTHDVTVVDGIVCTGRAGPSMVLDIVRRRIGGYKVPESVFERMLAECLKSPLLSGIVRQHRLLDANGDFVCRFDFAVPWAKVGIEAHSRSYHLGELVERYDEHRDMRAAKEGWETVYLGFAATRSPERVRHDVEQIVQRRIHDLGLLPPDGTQLQLLTP
jgi:very-short-patch-repair endonuclease